MNSPASRLSDLMDSNHVGTAAEMYFRACLFLEGCKWTPTCEDLVSRFGVSKATGYRWINAWRAAKGEAA